MLDRCLREVLGPEVLAWVGCSVACATCTAAPCWDGKDHTFQHSLSRTCPACTVLQEAHVVGQKLTMCARCMQTACHSREDECLVGESCLCNVRKPAQLAAPAGTSAAAPAPVEPVPSPAAQPKPAGPVQAAAAQPSTALPKGKSKDAKKAEQEADKKAKEGAKKGKEDAKKSKEDAKKGKEDAKKGDDATGRVPCDFWNTLPHNLMFTRSIAVVYLKGPIRKSHISRNPGMRPEPDQKEQQGMIARAWHAP